jgi:hypothetical protein
MFRLVAAKNQNQAQQWEEDTSDVRHVGEGSNFGKR